MDAGVEPDGRLAMLPILQASVQGDPGQLEVQPRQQKVFFGEVWSQEVKVKEEVFVRVPKEKGIPC